MELRIRMNIWSYFEISMIFSLLHNNDIDHVFISEDINGVIFSRKSRETQESVVRKLNSHMHRIVIFFKLFKHVQQLLKPIYFSRAS